MAPADRRSWVLCWAILALSWGNLGTMLGFVGSSWAYVGPAWLGTMLGVPGFYVGPSWLYLGAILGHVARRSNLTPWNSLQRAHLGACCATQQLDSLEFSPKSSFYCNLQCFFAHFQHPNHPAPRHPPMAPYVGHSWVLCWAILAYLGPS